MTTKKQAALALCIAGIAMWLVPSVAEANEVPAGDRWESVPDWSVDCLPIADFGLRGVTLGEPEDAAKDRLGAPLRITEGSGEDDGGQYVEVTYHYADMEISIVRGVVDRIYTDMSNVGVEPSLRVGLSMAEITATMGRAPRGWQSGKSGFSLVTCPEDGEWVQEDYVFMKLDEAGVLESIEFRVNRP